MNAADVAEQTTAVILAGGRGSRLGALTRDICKPALPFGVTYRTIDFSLSNCMNSGVRRIGVAVQHQRKALLGHLRDTWQCRVELGHGQFIEAWSAVNRAPFRGYAGTAHAVRMNLDTILRTGCRFVLILAGDHVYKMDYREMLAHHCRHRADATVAAIDVPAAEAHHYGVLSVDAHDWVRGFVEKPREVPTGSSVVASMGVYVFDARFLDRTLRRFERSRRPWHDFGHDLLPALVEEAKIAAFRFRTPQGAPGYWRDVGTPTAYWRAHMDLLRERPLLRLDDPSWPTGPTANGASGLSRYGVTRGAPGEDHRASLVARGATVQGTVRRSVLFDGACVRAGALVEDAVLLPGAHVGAGCRLRRVIVDRDCSVPEATVIDGPDGRLDRDDRAEPAVLTAADFSRPRTPNGIGRHSLLLPESIA